ncbi:MAG: tRNA (N(6)-L-threonylcarbamoyladenosine(37)-C(2))-methylthiotransferase MtaB [Lachnospiraceae bacterium]|nr:tRNA (N(6)-L-threonylcarbamoyladenosine(37)-C(2))-methylthiotransferase MtaB [Lachnospiraceae bacterium]
MKRVSFHTLGCKVNAYETEAMQQRMEAAGYTVVPFGEAAEVCIINTCTVTNIADRKSRQMLHKAKKSNPDSVVVAVGCYVESGLENCKQDDSIDIIVGNNRKAEIVEIIEGYLAARKSSRADEPGGISADTEKAFAGKNVCADNVFMTDMSKTADYEDMPLVRVENHTRAYIKIQDGCNQFCTYCIIPYTRGRIRSRSLQSIIDEVEILSKEGYKEIVLTGIHLSSYGKDLTDCEDNLLTVVKRLSEIDGIERIRLGSLEPRIITEEFMQELGRIKEFCPHFHLSLQSGSESVLKRMNRHYTPGEYYDKCCLIRKIYPNAAITTDVIVGFPGETKEEAKETFEFLKKVNFAEMHIFKYSMRNGTKAAKMSGQIPESIKNERSAELIKLGEEMTKEFEKRFIGTIQKVLFEEKVLLEEKKYWSGYTAEYVKVLVPVDNMANDTAELTGKLAEVLLAEIASGNVFGSILAKERE